jgi:ABC-2 type transport system permease protein
MILALLKKEYFSFFSSLIGLGLLFIFFLTIGLYSWFFQGNIFDFGFAELSVFFVLSPWFFMFFIPALCMKLFAEEYELQTFGLLQSLPISINEIILGKCLGAFMVILTCLLPTLLYVYSIGQLGSPKFNFDTSIFMGSYLSILFLTIEFILLSTFASSLTNKQPLAFLLGFLFNFISWQLPEELSSIPLLDFLNLEITSLKFHFMNMNKGVLDLNDIAFFIGFGLIIYALISFQIRRK